MVGAVVDGDGGGVVVLAGGEDVVSPQSARFTPLIKIIDKFTCESHKGSHCLKKKKMEFCEEKNSQGGGGAVYRIS